MDKPFFATVDVVLPVIFLVLGAAIGLRRPHLAGLSRPIRSVRSVVVLGRGDSGPVRGMPPINRMAGHLTIQIQTRSFGVGPSGALALRQRQIEPERDSA